MAPLVTLTTDFGTRDPYVAAMKGVIHSRCESVSVVDLSHEIAPHNILEAALFIATCADRFPAGTIHTVVVDPGVGTERHPVVVSSGGYRFVCPDNGLLTLFLQKHPIEEVRIIAGPESVSRRVSGTFHGRDIFAPTAAMLACGIGMESIGPGLSELARLSIPRASREPSGIIVGEIIHIDRFGNLITNIHRTLCGGSENTGRGLAQITAGGFTLDRISDCYGDVPAGDVQALWGGSDYLEIAVNLGNAHETLGLSIADPVTILI